ncbi:MAG: PF20097 family protein [Methanobacteriota archaeon]
MDVKCPKCGQPMEAGYLGTESLVGGAKWYLKKTVLALDGEKLKEPDMSGMVYIDSLRCKECRVILARY